MILCDTDWLIEFLRGRDEALRVVSPLIAAGLAISIVSIGELYEGVLHGRNPSRDEQHLLALLGRIDVIDLDIPAMRVYGLVRGGLRSAGLSIGDNDLQIAATALRHDLTLVTRNRRHFERVPGLRLHDTGTSPT